MAWASSSVVPTGAVTRPVEVITSPMREFGSSWKRSQLVHSSKLTTKVTNVVASASHFLAPSPGTSITTTAPSRGRKVMIESR